MKTRQCRTHLSFLPVCDRHLVTGTAPLSSSVANAQSILFSTPAAHPIPFLHWGSRPFLPFLCVSHGSWVGPSDLLCEAALLPRMPEWCLVSWTNVLTPEIRPWLIRPWCCPYSHSVPGSESCWVSVHFASSCLRVLAPSEEVFWSAFVSSWCLDLVSPPLGKPSAKLFPHVNALDVRGAWRGVCSSFRGSAFRIWVSPFALLSISALWWARSSHIVARRSCLHVVKLETILLHSYVSEI